MRKKLFIECFIPNERKDSFILLYFKAVPNLKLRACILTSDGDPDPGSRPILKDLDLLQKSFRIRKDPDYPAKKS